MRNNKRTTRKKRGGSSPLKKSRSITTTTTLRNTRSMNTEIKANCETSLDETHPFKKLARYVPSVQKLFGMKFRVAFRFFESKCQLFIYEAGKSDPHIHIYNYLPCGSESSILCKNSGKFHYSITDKQIYNQTATLWTQSDVSYRSALIAMMNQMTGKNVIEENLMSPPRTPGKTPGKPSGKTPLPKQLMTPQEVREEARISVSLGPTQFKQLATPTPRSDTPNTKTTSKI